VAPTGPSSSSASEAYVWAGRLQPSRLRRRILRALATLCLLVGLAQAGAAWVLGEPAALCSAAVLLAAAALAARAARRKGLLGWLAVDVRGRVTFDPSHTDADSPSAPAQACVVARICDELLILRGPAHRFAIWRDSVPPPALRRLCALGRWTAGRGLGDPRGNGV